MTSYPGTPSIAPDVQKRIVDAFRHSVESAANGDLDQARVGCDFVLRLDAGFDPARTLLQMLEQGRPPEAIRGLLGLVGPPAAPPSAAHFAAAAPGLVATFSRLLEARRFEELLSAAQSQAAAVAGDPKLADLVSLAQARYEAEPFVREQLDLARRALGQGQLDEVSAAVERARGLDASHPGLAEIERMRASASSMSNSLTIDWDEEDHSIPPPPEFAAREMPPAPSTPPAAPAEPEAPTFGPPSDLDLPEFDFSAPPTSEVMPPEPEPSSATPAGVEPNDTAPGVEFDAPGAGEFALPEVDFSAAESVDPSAVAPGAGDEESADDGQSRVRALLDEGEAAFSNGDYQAAIDSWSRIFLLDIDNEEAARRIEKARQLKAEQEREVEEIFHDGVARFDAGDWEASRQAFRRVLDQQPSYVLAREYLDKLDEREAMGAAPAGLPEMAPLGEAPSLPSGADAAEPPARRRGEEILVPPEPGGDTAGARRPAVEGFSARRKRAFRPTPAFLGIGSAVLLALVAGGWYLATNWSRFFPNAAPPAKATSGGDVITRAKKLQESGQTAVAIAQLRRVPPQDASYAEAQSLVSQWEKLVEKPAESAVSPAEGARRGSLIERARGAIANRENLLAKKLLTEAATIAPLSPDEAELSLTVEQKMSAYSDELGLYREGEYERLLNRLWRRHEADPLDRDVSRLMVDAYYNVSVQDLQRGDPTAARDKLREARKLDANDPGLERLERFASTYERRDQDLQYRIFVKYLVLR